MIKQVRCNICCADLISKKALKDPIDLKHNIAIEKETRTFDTFEDFELWKESVEKQTSSLYVKNTGSKSETMGGKIIHFYSHRNGYYNVRGDKKRNMKVAGSNNMNGNCPSKMKVYEDIESKMSVEFTKIHVGHGIDLGWMKMAIEEKDIARKLENKIPVEAILDEIRNSANSFNNPARYKKYKRGIQYKL
ncbi:zinc finger protein 432-like isoform X1 [Trichonephila inaurata madagascariensis]|uniref:Zinc finger protein 432-like isoform X1 n=1 Tax=Trichonephila inaurata madagascariensis TaxID=2747483 RepID=A0A8X6Y4J3_9ARAC|nr:zinc finger protein 432-like isoform X1 [Trichonephila inaurata madagascariensis]